MWKNLQPFGHRRSNSKRGKHRQRTRANTLAVEDISSARPEITKPHSPSPPRAAPPGPSTRQLMTTATVNDVHQHAPSKASLKAWWNHFAFAQRAKRDAEEKRGEHRPRLRGCAPPLTSFAATAVPPQGPVFGRPLRESLQRASVQISTAGNNGELFVWGHIPVVVAKWYVPPVFLRFPSSSSPSQRVVSEGKRYANRRVPRRVSE